MGARGSLKSWRSLCQDAKSLCWRRPRTTLSPETSSQNGANKVAWRLNKVTASSLKSLGLWGVDPSSVGSGPDVPW